jgi:molybdopterin molybdotransferase
MTGAPLPPGTEAVIPVERARRRKAGPLSKSRPSPDLTCDKGESIKAGARLLEAGRRLTPETSRSPRWPDPTR